MRLRLGTRGSDLALTQSRRVAGQLQAMGVDTELVVISTSGDRSDAPSFGAIGPQGVFVREIEQALLESRIDLAVHSFKDLPTTSPDGLVVAAVPARRDPADWLFRREAGESPGSAPDITNDKSGEKRKLEKRGLTLTEWGLTPILRPGARVGTSSARRCAWLRHFGSGLDVQPLRGNVPTRLKRLADGDYDAILLAGAGVERLLEGSDALEGCMDGIATDRLDPAAFVPAPAQGALALQCREDDTRVREMLAEIDDQAARDAVSLERRALALAEGGCDTAFGAWAAPAEDGFVLSIMIEREGRILSAVVTGDADDQLAENAFERLATVSGSAA